MKKFKILSLALAVAMSMPALATRPIGAAFAGSNVQLASQEAAKTSVFDGVSLTQKGMAGGGLMLDGSVLSTTDLSQATYLVLRYYNPTGAAWPFQLAVQMNNAITYLTPNTEYYTHGTSGNHY